MLYFIKYFPISLILKQKSNILDSILVKNKCHFARPFSFSGMIINYKLHVLDKCTVSSVSK